MIAFDPDSTSPPTRPRRTVVGSALRTLAWGGFFALLAVVATFAWEAGRPPDWERPRSPKPRQPANSVVPESTRKSESTAASGAERVEASEAAETQGDGETAANVANRSTSSGDREEPAEPDSPSDRAELAERLEWLESAVVRIETGDDGEFVGLGSGFVIDSSGLVATSYHVVGDSTEARVRFKNGAAYAVAGYRAVDRELDLAVLQIEMPPTTLRALELADAAREPSRLSPVVAIGHPGGVEYSTFDGKVSRTVTTGELPAGSQRFVRRAIEGRANQRWIQHTAGLSEGNSGGPLLDSSGAVIGVNTWVDREARFSYALHADHLRELLSRPLNELAPLARYARPEARTLDALNRLTPERMEALFAEAQKFDWRPETVEQYEVLQQLAWSVTVVQLPDTFSRGKLNDRLDALSVTAARVVRRLAEQPWDALGQVTLVNDLATPRLFRPMEGQFLFATVERVVEGDDGTRGAILKLAGEAQPLFLPLDRELSLPDAGLQCLVLGVNYDGHRVRYGDNPLKLITAPVIATRTILPLKSR